MEPNQIKIYITKYALTQGILEKDAKIVEPGMVVVNDGVASSYYHGDDWHETLDDAKERAEQMRRKKVESLKKQLARVEALTF